MQQRRSWLALFTALLVLCGVTACSDDSNGAEGDDPSQTTTTVVWPDEDRSTVIDGGQVLFHQWDDDSSRQLATVPSDGGEVAELAMDGFGGVLGPTVAPDGRAVAALGWDPAVHEETTTVLLGDSGGLEPLYTDSELSFRCVRWFPDGQRLLVTAFDEEAPDPHLLEIDLDGGVTQLQVPAGRYECAVPLDDGRIVLTYAGEGIDLVAMALVEPGSDDIEVLYSKVGCLMYGPSLSPSRNELVAAASCEEPTDSGLHVIDIATGEADHILVGEVAYPSYSPSGDWITFALFPNPDALKATIWALERDGTGLRQVSEVIGTQPAWATS